MRNLILSVILILKISIIYADLFDFDIFDENRVSVMVH